MRTKRIIILVTVAIKVFKGWVPRADLLFDTFIEFVDWKHKCHVARYASLDTGPNDTAMKSDEAATIFDSRVPKMCQRGCMDRRAFLPFHGYVTPTSADRRFVQVDRTLVFLRLGVPAFPVPRPCSLYFCPLVTSARSRDYNNLPRDRSRCHAK